uniref:Uncharacterized protein n=1 Tax=Anguilla anguilla TaxID=7936 RepID=A0A0E9SZF8_ANGAN
MAHLPHGSVLCPITAQTELVFSPTACASV